jgi:hypothetical protein
MKIPLVLGVAAMFLISSTGIAQTPTAPSSSTEAGTSPVQLEVNLEVAATDSNGYPSAFRVTLTNTGNVAVDLPMPNFECDGPDGGLIIVRQWTSPDGKLGSGEGCGSSISDRAPLLDRARLEWLRLQPGEYLSHTQNVRPYFTTLEPGKVEYWAEYRPAVFSSLERLELRKASYVSPTEAVTTRHSILSIL